ncbi:MULTISPECIES: IclR family transcriptional regulator [Amycolatopsis]|uniref:IclR family transcriptional regulator n=1 Tax=Amycolatopsis dendrobii TaxID=2760662 RepID=A0A7W3VZQ1_9PSEU|nr:MULTISPECIES: IclR family transcriptional regulator [Amycolatopsis]MBB1156171.1 IclR family transcriptional regulator [Amycolatopsis dendrobii]UKD58699.1 IclR family transcriptional regulator [Amycolatopsis sp. FU40]
MNQTGAQPPAGTQAIRRALGILRLLMDEDGELTLSAIARKLDLTPGTTHRVVRALSADGLVAHNPRTDSYHLGPGSILLGQAAQRVHGLQLALPVIQRINADTGESVNITIREGNESVVLLRAQSTLPLRFEQHPGARFPLYATASGKAMLANSLDAESYLASLPEQLPALTPHTLATRDALAVELAETRDRGYSIDNEENVAGVRCVGAGVLDDRGLARAAVVIQVPTVRLPEDRVAELGALAIDAAKEIAPFLPPDRLTRY